MIFFTILQNKILQNIKFAFTNIQVKSVPCDCITDWYLTEEPQHKKCKRLHKIKQEAFIGRMVNKLSWNEVEGHYMGCPPEKAISC